MKHQPRKRFGQNFLHDQNVINRIIQSFHPQPGDTVVEIGPGLGALTAPLLKVVKTMQAIELDRDIIPKLAEICGPLGELNIHQGDVLKFDFAQLSDNKLRLVGNLPYNISTPLIFHLMKQLDVIQDMHFMLQKEVVDRICAQPGNKNYGRLSVMVQYHCQASNLFTVSPRAFNPPPKVNSAILRLVPHPSPIYKVSNYERFAAIVRTAFNQRRKTLRNSLKELVPPSTFEILNIPATQRPEQLSISDFIAISEQK